MRQQPIILSSILLILQFLSFNAIAQRQADTLQHLKRNLIRVFSSEEWMELKSLDSTGGSGYDTSLHHFHRFDPAYAKELAWQDLGNPCTPVFSLEMQPLRPHGFQLTRDYYTPLFQQRKQYFRTPIALSDFKYTQGPPNLLFLEAFHTQNITPSWNVGIEYRHCASSNLFYDNLPNRERTRMSTLFSTRLFSSYQSKDSSYLALFDAGVHRLRTQESAGLTDISRYEAFQGRDREFNNTAALGNALNRLNLNQIEYSQLWRKKSVQWKHESALGRDMNRFESAAQSWFRNNYFSNETFDSLRHFYWNNTLWTEMKRGTNKVSAGLHHEYHRVSQPNQTIARYNNVGYQFRAARGIGDNQKNLHWKHDLKGYNQNDFQLNALLKHPAGMRHNMALNIVWQQRRPDFLQQYFVSNHFIWGLEKLNKEQHLHGMLSLGQKNGKWHVEAGAGRINQAVYFSQLGKPLQNEEAWRYARMRLNGKFQTGVFHFNPQLLFQGQNKVLWNYPAAAAKLSVYSNFLAFKGNMRIHTGLDFIAHSAYSINAWNPATRQFIPGSTGTKRSQFNINGFLNAQVRTVRAFVMYQRINDFMNIPLYATEGHPQLPAVLRFGIGWTMYN